MDAQLESIWSNLPKEVTFLEFEGRRIFTDFDGRSMAILLHEDGRRAVITIPITAINNHDQRAAHIIIADEISKAIESLCGPDWGDIVRQERAGALTPRSQRGINE